MIKQQEMNADMEQHINQYCKGVYGSGVYSLFLGNELGLKPAVNYFKAIEMAESTSNGVTPSLILSRNMLASDTKIAFKGMTRVMQNLNAHWELASNYGFESVLEKAHAVNAGEKIDDTYDEKILICTLNLIVTGAVRYSLVLLDGIIKSLDTPAVDESNDRYKTEKLAKIDRLKSSIDDLVKEFGMLKLMIGKASDKIMMNQTQRFKEFNSFVDKNFLQHLKDIVDNNTIIAKLAKGENVDSYNKTALECYETAMNEIYNITLQLEGRMKNVDYNLLKKWG